MGSLGRIALMKQGGRAAPKVALVLFNTLTKNGLFWGNLNLSLFAGSLSSLNIENGLFALMMDREDREKNQKTIDEFIAFLVAQEFNYIVMHSSWLSWLPEDFRKKTKAKVFCLDSSDCIDVPVFLHPVKDVPLVIISAILGYTRPQQMIRLARRFSGEKKFNPRFNFTFFGASGALEQKKAFVTVVGSCPYRKDVRSNPAYKRIRFENTVSTHGCSYCAAAKASPKRPMAEQKKRILMVEQVRYLQAHLPSLKEIAVVYPELYLRALPWIMRNSKRLGITPVIFSGQFRAEVLSRHEADIGVLLQTALDTGFRFVMSVVGLESFCSQDLMIFNRGSVGEVRKAVKVITRLRNKFDPGFFMPETVGSFIFFHPWQTVAGLKENIRFLLSEGIRGLFPTLNFNDIRINQDVAVYELAKAHKYLLPAAGGNVNDIPLGGYFAEYPWGFKDKKTEQIHALYTGLANKVSDRIGLLEALCDYAGDSSVDHPSSEGKKILSRLAGLFSLLLRYYGHKDSEGTPVYIGDTCNASCRPCIYEHARFIKGLPAALRMADAVFSDDQQVVTIAGREPTLLPWLLPFIKELKRKNPRRIQLVTNARRCVYPHYAASLVGAGVTDFLVKFFSWRPQVHDQFTRSPGSFGQSVAGIAELKRSVKNSERRIQVVLLAVVTDAVINELNETILFAQRIGADEVRFICPMNAVNLAGLRDTTQRLTSVLSRRQRSRLRVGTDPRFSFSMTL
jgi:hypothetical protein